MPRNKSIFPPINSVVNISLTVMASMADLAELQPKQLAAFMGGVAEVLAARHSVEMAERMGK